ncbi:MAG: anhydro-N-acetylmuramic acid kinase [Gammaproteobacteria bacterium]|nr:anhydro-N-acetylmuramic acid kinase [Gammaproteobacteria bacterium]
MSGTSLDGIDAVLTDVGCSQILATHWQPLPNAIVESLGRLHQSDLTSLSQLMQLHQRLGLCYSEAVNTLLAESRVTPGQVEAIGCHGQTVRHEARAELPVSLQIGNPAILAEQTGITVVSDFRSGDIAAGGEGAPLAPAFHAARFFDSKEHRVLVNIGGISNLTNLEPGGKPIRGYDVGPGNGLMDSWCHRHQGQAFDAGGHWAASGEPSQVLLNQLLKEPYFSRSAPKSTGREYFNLGWLESHLPGTDLNPEDIQATLCELTAQSITSEIKMLNHTPDRVLICGGGAKNSALMARLRYHLPTETSLETTAALGIDPDWVEAAAFAWLAMRRLKRLPGNLPEATGAHHPAILGTVTRPWTAGKPRS